MAFHMLAVIAASALVTPSANVVSQTRSAAALPKVERAQLIKAAAKLPASACFVPTKAGKMPKLADLRKARSAKGCEKVALIPVGAAGVAGAFTSGALTYIPIIVAGIITGYTVYETTSGDEVGII